MTSERNMKTKRHIDFIGRKTLVNNLRIKVNMLSSNLPALLRKTLAPTKAVRRVSTSLGNQVGHGLLDLL